MPKFKLKDYIKIKGEYTEVYKIVLISNDNYYLRRIYGKLRQEICDIKTLDRHAEKIDNIELYKALYV